ncbi:MAG: glucosamine-6-phosphate deaminase [Chloroflexi bacterium]|nr:glucosamine-6-phosphate deaminase [Chloroflexota bacterium]
MNTPTRELKCGQLSVVICANNAALGVAAAEQAIAILRAAITAKGQANAILATGNSQLTMLAVLREANLDWSRVNLFHMDEYIGLTDQHPASFRRFLREKLVDAVHPAAFYGVQGDVPDIPGECRRYTELLQRFPADLCCLGIGENGHLAFNDPPFADFTDPLWVKVVELDEVSRRQQVGEGHFPALDAVPKQAITLTIPALLAARRMVCSVPEARKAAAVKAALTGPITPSCPASIMRTAAHATLLLDQESAALL